MLPKLQIKMLYWPFCVNNELYVTAEGCLFVLTAVLSRIWMQNLCGVVLLLWEMISTTWHHYIKLSPSVFLHQANSFTETAGGASSASGHAGSPLTAIVKPPLLNQHSHICLNLKHFFKKKKKNHMADPQCNALCKMTASVPLSFILMARYISKRL